MSPIKFCSTTATVALATTSFATAQAPPSAAGIVPDRYIVQTIAGNLPGNVAQSHGVAADLIFSKAVNGFAATIGKGRLAALQKDPRVTAIIPDRIVTGNPRGGGGKPDKPVDGGDTGGDPPATRVAQQTPSGVDRIGAAPGKLTFTGSGVGVAIVDTGIDFAHPDLTPGETSFKAVIVKRRSISTSTSPTAGQDDDGHGTHVAGIVAASNDGFDVVGVAPAATPYAVKVLNSRGQGTDSTVIAGLDWIAANAEKVDTPIKVVNMSLGRSGSIGDNPVYRDAIKTLYNLGITIVVAAGNDCATEVSGQVPACYPEVIAIASTTAVDGVSDGSADQIISHIAADTASFFTTDGTFDTSTGTFGVAVSAPGEKQEDIEAGSLVSIGILSCKLGGGTTRSSGTSMASPHAAGVAALIIQKLEELELPQSPDTIRGLIIGSAWGTGSVPLDIPTNCYSFDDDREGILDAAQALAAADPAD